jgi:hypothetical protein
MKKRVPIILSFILFFSFFLLANPAQAEVTIIFSGYSTPSVYYSPYYYLGYRSRRSYIPRSRYPQQSSRKIYKDTVAALNLIEAKKHHYYTQRYLAQLEAQKDVPAVDLYQNQLDLQEDEQPLPTIDIAPPKPEVTPQSMTVALY